MGGIMQLDTFNELNPFESNIPIELEGILIGEIAATEAYENILNQLSDHPEANRLQSFYHDHQDAVDYWKHQMTVSQGEPSDVWKNAVKAFIGSNNVVGNNKAIAALLKGEEYGLNLYKYMLNSMKISPAQKSYIRTVFLPVQEAHMQRLAGTKLAQNH
jgi:hypothetical protein